MTWTPEREGMTPARVMLIIAFAVFVGHALWYGSWISDDAGISFTYARNLAAGHGLVLNPGGERVEGYSNPLWVFLLSPFFAAGAFHAVAIPKLLSIALILASFEMLYRVSRSAFDGGESLLHATPALLLSLHVPFVTWSVSGLENPLYVFLILAALASQQRELSSPGSPPLSALFFFLVAITRPEGIAYFIAAGAHRAGIALLARRARGLLLWCAAFVAPFSVYHVWHYRYFADWVPNTYYAKIAGGNGWLPGGQLLDPESPGWLYVRSGLEEHGLLAVLPVSLGVLLLWRPASASLLIALMTGAGALSAVAMGGDWMPQYRFLFPVFALSYLALGGAALRMGGLLHARFPGRSYVRVAAFISIVLIGGWLTAPSARLLIDGSRHLSVAMADKIERGTRLGKLSETLRVEDASLLDPDLGGTSYASGLDLVDLAGLADLHIAMHGYDERFFGGYIFEERKPTFIHTHCFWSMRSEIHSYPGFDSDYVPIWERACPSACCPDTLDGEYVRRDVFLAQREVGFGEPVAFDGGVALVGLEPDRSVASPGDTLLVSSFWRRAGDPVGDLLIQLTLTGDGADVVTEERGFGRGLFPPDLWRAGETIREEWEIRIPEGPSSGMLSIVIAVSGPGISTRRAVGTIEVGREKVTALARRKMSDYQRFAAEGKTEEALASLSRACDIDTTLDACHGQLGAARIRRETEIWREAGDLMREGALAAASEMLLEAAERFGRHGAIAERLAECSRRWYERGTELAAREDAFLFWGETFDSFARAIECDPSNSFALKSLEESRARAYVAQRFGDRLAGAHAGTSAGAGIADTLLEIQDAGFELEVPAIISRSEPIGRALETDGSLAALALLHDRHLRDGDEAALEAMMARIGAITSRSSLVEGEIALLGTKTEAIGIGAVRFTWWFEVIGPVAEEYMMILRAVGEEEGGGTVRLDHPFSESTRGWKPGAIVRHTHVALLRSGSYRFRFSLSPFTSTPPAPAIEMTPLNLSRNGILD